MRTAWRALIATEILVSKVCCHGCRNAVLIVSSCWSLAAAIFSQAAPYAVSAEVSLSSLEAAERSVTAVREAL